MGLWMALYFLFISIHMGNEAHGYFNPAALHWKSATA